MVLAGCENKNSRSWIENKISAVERVYPTKNLYDLFEEFPNGFTVKVSDYYKVGDVTYKREIRLSGDSASQSIKGKVDIVQFEKKELEPVVEKQIESSEVEYIHSGKFILTNESVSKDLFPYEEKGFLFQQLTLNKGILSQFKLEDTYYNDQGGTSFITYKVQNQTINRYFGLEDNAEVMMDCFPSSDESNFAVSINYRNQTIDHWETIESGLEEEDE